MDYDDGVDLFCDGFQILLNIEILNAFRFGWRATVDNISTGDFAEAMLGFGALVAVDEVAIGVSKLLQLFLLRYSRLCKKIGRNAGEISFLV